MILVTMTVNSTTFYISDEYINTLTHQYEGFIKSLGPIHYATRERAGGYVEPQFGALELSPEMFKDNWPPPKSCAITISLTDTTEEAATSIFTGKAHREEITQKTVRYGLYGASYSNTISTTIWIDDTLDDVFTTYCGASYLNLTLNTDYARATAPSVYRQVEADTVVIDLLSELAEATNHLFYISGTTLYLVDMLLDNGTAQTVTEFDFFPVRYEDSEVYKRFKSAGAKKTYSVAGSYAYGQREESDVANNIEHIWLRVGDNSGNDMARLFYSEVFPYETGVIYMTQVKLRRPAGTGAFFCGLLGFASDRTTVVDRLGGTGYGYVCWHVASAPTLTSYSSDWLTKTGYSSGWANPASYVEAGDPASPGTLYDDGGGTKAEYFKPCIMLNYNGATGMMDVDYIAIYEVNSSGVIQQEIFYDDFVNTNIWEWWDQSRSGGNRERSTSLSASTSAILTHLGNRKTIMESPRATISLPLAQANIFNPGQKISWTDESVVPTSENYINVSAGIRVRSIAFDLNNYKITYEGEGTLT